VNNVVILARINIYMAYPANAIMITLASFHKSHGVYGVVKVFVTGVENASCNEPFFISRLSKTIKHYSIHFDTLDVVTSSSSEKHRIVFEKEILGRQILNIIACEGTSRVERFESYKQWQRCIQRSGFIQRPLPFKNATQKVNYESILGSYDKRFGIGKDDGWLFIGWKNEIMCAFSTWKPVPLRMKV